jgi:plasmid stabilization system protein ParE
MYHIILKPRAILMVKEAYEWYEKQKKELGEEFLGELDTVYKKLKAHPQYYSKVKKDFRQCKLKRFPFVIIYQLSENQVLIFAVFHTKRNPKRRFKN